MNILLATYWYLPHVGGVDVYVNILRKRYEQMGHRVDVLAHHPHMEKIYMQNTGETVEKSGLKDLVYEKVYEYYETHFPHVDPWIRWREIERYVFELAALYFGLNHYDLIHTQDIISTRAIHRVKPRHVKHVATIHGLLANEHVIAGDIGSKDSLAWKYAAAEEYYGSTSADGTILPTQWLHGELTHNFQVPQRNLHIIPYGMDIDDFLSKSVLEPEGVTLLPDKKYLICPARLVPVKGHQYLLEALARLKETRDDFVCWIVGSGDLGQSLKQTARQLGLDQHAVFLGARSDVPALMKRAHITVLPSVQDNLPFTVMESQIMGVPVVASRTGGIPEMIRHGETGILFETKNSAELATYLELLLSNDELRYRIGEESRKWGLEHWSPSTLVQRTWAVYEQALEGKVCTS